MDSEHEANSFGDFLDRFFALQEDAKQYGITSVVCLEEHDPFAKDTGVAPMYVGTLTTAVGLVDRARFAFLKDGDEMKRLE